MSGVLGGLSTLRPENLYVFSFDFTNTKANLTGLLEYIKDSRHISNWAYYTSGTFLLRSRLPAIELSEALRRVGGDINCFVIEANANNVGGWLPETAWDWFRQHQAPLSPLAAAFASGLDTIAREPSAPTNALASLFENSKDRK